MATLTKEQVERIDSKNEKIYKYYKDDRQPNEVLLAAQLTRALSELNFQSLNSKHISTSTRKAVKREDILYVCLPGVPPFPNEFQNLNLPGQVILFEFISFQKGYSEEELMTMQTELDTQAKILHQRINQASTTKPIVFVYHSFGTYALASYWSLFKNDRIIGLIDLGGAPIRFYEAIKEILRSQDGYTIDFIQENIDMVYHFFTERNKKFGVSAYEKKSQVLGMCRAFKSKQFQDMFVKVRNLPKVLKCFVYGRKDLIFPETFISEKMAYYCYKNKFQPQYQLQLQKAYERFYGRKCQNVQERFIFSIQGGHHSIHMQRKYKQMMGAISTRFISFLQEVHAVQPSKL